MKFKYIYILVVLAAFLFQSCEDGYETYDGIYITGTLDNNPVVSLKVSDQFPIPQDLIIGSTNVVAEDVTVEMKVDGTKIEEYNSKFGTNFELLPIENVTLTHPTVVIKKGDFTTTTPVKVYITGLENTVEGKKYMIPVTITKTSNTKVIEASRTVYIALDQVIVTSALDLGSGRLAVEFWNGTEEALAKYNTKALEAVTFEMRVYMNGFNNDFNTLMGLEENILIRTSSYNNQGGILDCTGGNMGNIISPRPFPTGVWTHVAMTYNKATMNVSLYINGERIASREVTRKDRELINLCAAYEGGGWDDQKSKFYIGYSAGGRSLNGKVSEARVWAKALTQPEIANNMCYVDPTTEGLVAYWRFNENDPSVTEFEDLTGHGFNAKLVNTGKSNWIQKVRCPE